MRDQGATRSDSGAAAAALELVGVSKTFGKTRVLDGVSLRLAPGEIVGLIGRNGSGKSTLIKILSGYHAPDSGGSLRMKGESVPLPLLPDQAAARGLSFMHQDLGLSVEMSVLENIRVGRFETGMMSRIKWRAERATVVRALDEFDVRVSPDALVGDLTELDRALVALVRSLLAIEEHGPGVLVLDEPTAFMPRDDVELLFEAVRRLASRGSAVIFVSHRLDEVMQLTDRIVVLRDGRMVSDVDTSGATEDELVHSILGRKLEGYYPESTHVAAAEPNLGVKGLTGSIASDVSFDVHAGEVVGLTGLRGMGHEEVPYLIYGAKRASEGRLNLAGELIEADAVRPRKAIKMGAVLVPSDRPRLAVVPSFAVSENVSLPVLNRYFRKGRLRRGEERRDVEALLTDFEVNPNSPGLAAEFLSGGNQQKMLLGKWLQCNPTIHLFHEPTVGVDVGAKRSIFEKIEEIAQNQGSVLISSEEWGDLANLCDRVLVFRDGRVAAELAGADCTEDRIVEQCYRN